MMMARHDWQSDPSSALAQARKVPLCSSPAPVSSSPKYTSVRQEPPDEAQEENKVAVRGHPGQGGCAREAMVRQNATDLTDEEVQRWVVAEAESRKELLF
jgi:hypothetical protein